VSTPHDPTLLRKPRAHRPRHALRHPRAPRLTPGARVRSLVLSAVAVALLAPLGACISLSTRPASFRVRPDSVAPGNLRGPYRGRVVEADTGEPVAGALVYASWTLHAGYGMTLPAGHREYVTNTDARGLYTVPSLEAPGPGVRITDFDLVIYKRGYVAYRSDRRFADLGPRHDFAQVDNQVELVRWREGFSHAHHLRYVGGGPALASLTAWEGEEAAAELTQGPGDGEIATPLQVQRTGARLVAARLLTAEDVKAATGFDGEFETGPLGEEPDTEAYSSQHLKAMGLPEHYDVALRVWRASAEEAEQRYGTLLDSLPGVREVDELGDRSLRATEGNIFGIGFVDRSRGVVVLITCGQSQCASLDVASRLGAVVQERLRAQIPARAATPASPTPPASPAPDDAAPAPGTGAAAGKRESARGDEQ